MMSVADSMLSKTYMQGLAEFLGVLTSRRPQDLEKNRFLKGFLASFVPSAVAQIEREVDPTVRATYSMFDEIYARIPGLSATLKPRLNRFGEPVLVPPGYHPDWLPGWVSVFSPVRVTEFKNDPVFKALINNQVSIGPPPAYIYGRDPSTPHQPDARDAIPLTAEQHYWYQRLAGKDIEVQGKNLRAMLTEVIASPMYQKLTPGPGGSQADLLRSISSQYDELAREALINPQAREKLAPGSKAPRFPDLEQAWATKQIEMGVLKGGEAVRPSLNRAMERVLERLNR
jgi:hypothetical protein